MAFTEYVDTDTYGATSHTSGDWPTTRALSAPSFGSAVCIVALIAEWRDGPLPTADPIDWSGIPSSWFLFGRTVQSTNLGGGVYSHISSTIYAAHPTTISGAVVGRFERSPSNPEYPDGMPPPHSYTLLEKLIGFFKNRWRPQRGDRVSDRMVSNAIVRSSAPFQWPVELRDLQLKTEPPGTVPHMDSLPGIPVQRVSATNRQFVVFMVNDTYSGTPPYPIQVPRPPSGFWVEGYPNPLAENGASGAWDNHVLIVCPETREAWELIGVNAEINWCLRYGYWKDGKLVFGHSVVAGDIALTSVMWCPGDPDHELGMVMNDYQGADGSKAPNSGWPRCGQKFRLSEAAYQRLIKLQLTAEQRRFVEILRNYGIRLFDRSGQGANSTPSAVVSIAQAGDAWAGSTLGRLPRITLGDLELAT